VPGVNLDQARARRDFLRALSERREPPLDTATAQLAFLRYTLRGPAASDVAALTAPNGAQALRTALVADLHTRFGPTFPAERYLAAQESLLARRQHETFGSDTSTRRALDARRARRSR
jgi:hypothetical protein